MGKEEDFSKNASIALGKKVRMQKITPSFHESIIAWI
jgi:hypothetical protein